MKIKTYFYLCMLSSVCCLFLSGCQCCWPWRACNAGPAYDRPFPLGQVTDAHWETQQTNAEASDFIFYDHEFVDDTAKLNPLGEKHLLQVALRMDHVPFPVVVEESINKNRKLDAERRVAIVDKLTQLGVCMVDQRVVVAPALAEGITAIEGEAAYYQTIGGGGDTYGGTGTFAGRGFGGFGGMRR